jgi:addiction module HigA family antidote
MTITRTAIRPGEHLLEVLEMSAAELARKMDVPKNRVTQILNGTRAVTGDTALRAGTFLWDQRAVLVEPAKPVRFEMAEEKAGKSIKTLPKLKRRELVQV